MSVEGAVRRLRPFLFTRFGRVQCLNARRSIVSTPAIRSSRREADVTHDYEKRVAQLEAHAPLSECYPRLPTGFAARQTPIKSFKVQHAHLDHGVTLQERSVTVAGRIESIRTAGSKLVFIDLSHEQDSVQIVCQLSQLQQQNSNLAIENFKTFAKTARKGDFFSVQGHPHRTTRGELSILATELPTLLAPSLHQIPESLDDAESRARHRHVTMLVDPTAIHTLKIRHDVELHLQEFFNAQGFTKVLTPIISAGAGGATARAFETEATELTGETLNLRIAPELWLKRLIVGGLPKVYEIGPAFRNEGVDNTHNPEFNICEFYEAYATLDDLILKTEELLRSLTSRLSSPSAVQSLSDIDFSGPFARLEFIPTLEKQMGCSLPDLDSQDSCKDIVSIFEARSLLVPDNVTLPRLLDALASHYIEPLCQQPTFITHHPACMSPLSKHFAAAERLVDGKSHIVAARAELFINGREYANMYEEENSPFEQRQKLQLQLNHRATDREAMDLDEAYLRALEWGLPPTGGWGCGMDRLVMLFAGKERLADVLAFGSLRNVVGLAKRG